MAEQLLAEIDLDGIPPDVIDAADLTVPSAWMDSAMAVDLVAYLRQYHTVDVQSRAARHMEDHAKAEELGKQKLYLRTIIGYIQWRHPGAKAAADALMTKQAKRD